jgi:C4-dicarboxylate transporter DctQ subunit
MVGGGFIPSSNFNLKGGSKMLIKLDKILCRIEEAIIAVGLLTAAMILFINVILRYFFQGGIVWAEEFTRYSIIWITFVGGSVAVRHGAHVSVNALLEVVKPRNKKLLVNFSFLISILFTIFLLIWGTKNTLAVKWANQLTPSMEIPAYLIYLAIPVGGLLMSVRLIQAFVKNVLAVSDIQDKGAN